MVKYITKKDIETLVNENKNPEFTTGELIMIKTSVKFLLKHYYNDPSNVGTMTHDELKSIRDKCIDALEK